MWQFFPYSGGSQGWGDGGWCNRRGLGWAGLAYVGSSRNWGPESELGSL